MKSFPLNILINYILLISIFTEKKYDLSKTYFHSTHVYVFLEIIFVLTKVAGQLPVCFNVMASRPRSKPHLFFFIPNHSCLTDKNEKPSLPPCVIFQISRTPHLSLFFCCYDFNNVLIGMSLFWRVVSRSGLLNVQDTDLGTNGLMPPSSPTSTPSPGLPLRALHPGTAFGGGQGCPGWVKNWQRSLSLSSETPQCSERTSLAPSASEESAGPSTLFQ